MANGYTLSIRSPAGHNHHKSINCCLLTTVYMLNCSSKPPRLYQIIVLSLGFNANLISNRYVKSVVIL